MNDDPRAADTANAAPSREGPVPVRAVDPRTFFPSYDGRHHHVELRSGAGRLAGEIDSELLPAAHAWAEREGLVPEVRTVVPRPAIIARAGRLRLDPSPHAVRVSEVRLGEAVEIVVREGDWCRVRTARDGYLGWLLASRLATGAYEPTHRVAALRGHLYTGPRVQAEVVDRVSWGDRLRVRDEVGDWSEVRLPDGRVAFLLSSLLAPVEESPHASPLDVWPEFLGTPYLWGGGSAWGIDCSGWIQLLYRMAGRTIPRDADEQFGFGTIVEDPKAGDLVCYRGHIGLYLGDDRMAHASGRAMRVVETPPFVTQADRERFLGFVRI